MQIQLIRRRRRGGSTPPVGTALVSDSFDRADGPIGTADGAYGGAPQAWTASAGFRTMTNQLGSTAGIEEYATVNAGQTDMAVSVTVTTLAGASMNVGVLARGTDNNNFYLAQVNTGGLVQLFRRAAGTFAQLAVTGSGAFAAGDVLSLGVVGAQVTVRRNGTVVHDVTDATPLTTGTRAGVRQDGNTAWRLDDFRVEPA